MTKIGVTMFAGCLFSGREQSPPTEPLALSDALLRRLAPLHEPDLTGRYVGAGAVLAQTLNWNTSESQRQTVPTVCPHTGNVLVSWLRLDNRGELARTLHLTTSDAAEMTDPDYVLAAYREWGTDTARHLQGDFAFAVFEPAARRIYLARDPMGIRPLYFARTPELFAFTTSLACMREFPGVDSTFSQKWLVFYLAAYSDSAPGLTALKGSEELLPGHQMVTVGGATVSAQYHEFRDDPPWLTEYESRYVKEYRESFFHAVELRTRSAYPMGSENSGGLDSASIISVMRDLHGADSPVHTFGMPQFVTDEPDMRRAVAGTSFGLHIVDRRSPGLLDAAQDAATVLGHPPEVQCSYFWRPFLQIASEQGVRTILSGNGGDHAVTARGDLFFRELALRWEWGLLARTGFDTTLRGRLRALRFMMEQHRRRHRDRPLTDKASEQVAQLNARCLTPHALRDFGLVQHTNRNAEWSLPHDTINSYALGHSLRGRVSRRAAESCQVGDTFKVEYRYPMLDPQLLQTFLSTPAIMKRTRGETRHLHRVAMSGILDESIRVLAVKNPGERLPGESEYDSTVVAPEDVCGSPAEGLIDGDRLLGSPPTGSYEEYSLKDLRFRLALLLRST